MNDLDARMLAAHETGDRRALIRLYTEAAEYAADIDAASFFLTHAYVFALEDGAPEAVELRNRLMAYGREE